MTEPVTVIRSVIVDGTERWLNHPFSLIRYRAFLEDLAALGGHVINLHDEFVVYAPEEHHDAVLGLVFLYCGPGPCFMRDLHESTRRAIEAIVRDLPNLPAIDYSPDRWIWEMMR